MINQIKTYVLLGVIIFFICFIGDAIGGPEGLYFAFILSFISAFVSYWFSDRIVLAMYNAYQAPPDVYTDLYNMVADLADSAKIPMPRIYIIPSDSPNAFATGRGPSNAAVAVTEGLLSLLSKKELKGVLAHEIAHIANYDVLLQTVVAVLAGTVGYLVRLVIYSRREFDDDANRNPYRSSYIVKILILAFAPLFVTLIQLAISRTREYLADETGARLCGHPEWLASALAKIDQAIKYTPFSSADPGTAHLFIANPFNISGVTQLFATHPPIKERIARLINMANRSLK